MAILTCACLSDNVDDSKPRVRLEAPKLPLHSIRTIPKNWAVRGRHDPDLLNGPWADMINTWVMSCLSDGLATRPRHDTGPVKQVRSTRCVGLASPCACPRFKIPKKISFSKFSEYDARLPKFSTHQYSK
jgi:hypothetical protein